MAESDLSRPLTLSREDLYELVWSKPIQELASDFGISDVALAKRCKRLRVPVPGRGYWARVAAGQMPHRPNLPPRDVEPLDRSALTVPGPPATAASACINEGDDKQLCALKSRNSHDAIRSRIAALTISPAPSLPVMLPAVKRAARHLKHPQRSELTFERGQKSGPMVDIDVTDACLDRALSLAHRLLSSADDLGWRFVSAQRSPTDMDASYRRDRFASRSPPTDSTEPSAKTAPAIGRLLIDGERIAFRVEERLREEVRIPTAAEPAESNDYLMAELPLSRAALMKAAGCELWNGSGGRI